MTYSGLFNKPTLVAPLGKTRSTPISQLDDVSICPRMTDADKLSFAKSGVFNPIDINDGMKAIVSNSIKDGHYWEWQTTKLGQKIVSPNCLTTTTKRTGTKNPKIKFRKHKLNECRISFSAHALERYYERSGKRGLSASDFYTTDFDKWIDTTSLTSPFEETSDERLILHTNKEVVLKTNWVLPFGTGTGQGAFLGSITHRPFVENETYQVFYSSNRPTSFIWKETLSLKPYFIANTFIHLSQMRGDQEELRNLILQGKYGEAKEMNTKMVRDEQIHLPYLLEQI